MAFPRRKGKRSKFGNTRTNYNGHTYDSKFEAGVAETLDWLLAAGEIAGWERQYRVHIPQHAASGKLIKTLSHRVDFRIEELDGTFTLLEAKGLATREWKEKKLWLEKAWLPEHPNHTYEVIYKRNHWRGFRV